jgi:hypothetical protein
VAHVVEHERRGHAVPQRLVVDDLMGLHIDLQMPAKGVHAFRERLDHVEGGGRDVGSAE